MFCIEKNVKGREGARVGLRGVRYRKICIWK